MKLNLVNSFKSHLLYITIIPINNQGKHYMFKQLFIWTFGTFILLQAIQIDIPNPPKNIDKSKEIVASKEIMKMLKTSCYDCHSYQTKMPWYGSIVPLAWEIKSNIKHGRTWLNFQEWNNYDNEKKQKIYKGIVKSINLRMPIPMYLKLHKDAVLSKEQRQSIKKWAKSKIEE
jgi:hypothetical protein